MATVEQVATEVLAAVDSSAGLLQAGQWVAQRYRQFASKSRLRHLREVGELRIPAPITTGLVTATQGSASVTANAAAQAVLSSAIIGRHLRVGSTWYLVSAYSAPTITLATAFAESTATSVGYSIVQRWSSLATDARWLGSFVHMRLRCPLRNVSVTVLDHHYPDRLLVASTPLYWAEVGEDNTTKAKLVEIYPYSSVAEVIHYVYWREPSILALTDEIPSHVDSSLCREGALVDLFRFKAAQAADKNQIEAAAFWRNESQVQRGVWERMCVNGAKQDRGVEDIGFILQRSGMLGNHSINDARSEIYARGNRP
jgi:hypothetical protein